VWLSFLLPMFQILSAVVNNDLRSLVEKRPLKAWKETLALLCTVGLYTSFLPVFQRQDESQS
jgi:hypothetical protein